MDSTCVLTAEPGKLDTWLYPYSNYEVIIDDCVDSESSATTFK